MNKKLLISLAALVLIIGVGGYYLSGTGLKGQMVTDYAQKVTTTAKNIEQAMAAKDTPFSKQVEQMKQMATSNPSIPSSDNAFKTFKVDDNVLFMGKGTNDWHTGKVSKVPTVQAKTAKKGGKQVKVAVSKYEVLADGEVGIIKDLDVNNIAHTDIHPTFNSLKIGDVVIVKSKAVSGAYYSAKVAAQDSVNKTISFEKAGDKVNKTSSISASNVYIPGGIVVALDVGKVGSAPEFKVNASLSLIDNGIVAVGIYPAAPPSKDNTYLTDSKGNYYFNYAWKFEKVGGPVIWDKTWYSDDVIKSNCLHQDIYDRRYPGVKIDNVFTCDYFGASDAAQLSLLKAGAGKYDMTFWLSNGDSNTSQQVLGFDLQAPMAGQKINDAMQNNIDIAIKPYAINPANGNAILRYTVDASKVKLSAEDFATFGNNAYFVTVKTFVDDQEVKPRFSKSLINDNYNEEISDMNVTYENSTQTTKYANEIGIWYDNASGKTCAFWSKDTDKKCDGMEPVVLPAMVNNNTLYSPAKDYLWFDSGKTSDYNVRFEFYRTESPTPIATYKKAFNLSKIDLGVEAFTPEMTTYGNIISTENSTFSTFYCNEKCSHYPPEDYNNGKVMANNISSTEPTYKYNLPTTAGYQGIKIVNTDKDNNYGIVTDPSKYTLNIYGKFNDGNGTYTDTGVYLLGTIGAKEFIDYSANSEKNGYVMNANRVACANLYNCAIEANSVLPIPGPGETNYLYIPRDKLKMKSGKYGDITGIELLKDGKLVHAFGPTK